MDNNSEVVYLHLDDIIPNRFQPREVFDEQALKELAVSIKEHGVIQPIIVRKVDNKYEIIAGERRYKASTMAGLNKIPAIIKNLDDKESSKVALIENLQRRDLTPIEEARTYQKILELEDNMTQEELAATMGKTQSSVSNKLRLLALPDEIQDALLNEKISERHARCLLNLEDENAQVKMLERIINEKLTVRELDRIIKEGKEGPSSSSSANGQLEGTETAQVVKPSIPQGPVIKGFPVVNNTEETLVPGVENIPAVEETQGVVEAPQEQKPEVAPAPEEMEPEGYNPALEEAIQHVEEGATVMPEVAPEAPKPVEENPLSDFNFDFSGLTNPFLKQEPAPKAAPVDNNVASAVSQEAVISSPIKDYTSVKTDIDSLVTNLKNKGFTANYNENDTEGKIEYIITIEK